MKLDLSQFTLLRTVLEVRYAQSFLVWDHAGLAWHELRSAFPTLSLRAAQPNQQTVLLTKGVVGLVALENSNITAAGPTTDHAAFADTCASFFPVVIKRLDISNFTRVGYRVAFQKTFDTREKAAEFALSQAPELNRSGKHFNIEGKPSDPQLAVRWEGDTTGVYIQLQSLHQKLDADIPPEFSDIQSIHVERYAVVVDIDYYAHGNTSVEKFQPKALVENWHRLIRRDVEGFLNG